MTSQIFVNLPVKDLKRSVDFFTALGFSFNPQFTDDNATCMIVSEHNFVMLLVEPFFQSFTKKPLSDAKRQTEVLVAISCDSRAAAGKRPRRTTGDRAGRNSRTRQWCEHRLAIP